MYNELSIMQRFWMIIGTNDGPPDQRPDSLRQPDSPLGAGTPTLTTGQRTYLTRRTAANANNDRSRF
jgi:hypothetical protein